MKTKEHSKRNFPATYTHKVRLRFFFVLRPHVVIHEADVGVVQHRVVVAYVYEQTWKTARHTL